MARPTERREWYQIKNLAAYDKAEDGAETSADVYIYDEIGASFWGGVDAAQFVADLGALDVQKINLFLNSPGGAAWDGIAIMNALRRHPAKVDVTVDGIAASIASVIAMAGDTVTMNRGSEMMVHDASGFVYGNAQDMIDTAAALGKLSDSIASVYAKRSGGTVEDWRTTMQAETWYTAEEAVTAGLADRLDESVDATASAHNVLERSAARDGMAAHFTYRGSGSLLLPVNKTPGTPTNPPAMPGEPTERKNVVTNDNNLAAGLRERFGLPADATDELLLAKVDDALKEPQKPTIPEGTILLDKGQFEELRSAASAGLEARAQQTSERRDAVVEKAVRQGRIAPTSVKTWRDQLDKDEEGTSLLLASLPENTINVREVGISDDVTSTDEDRLSEMAWPSDQKQEA